MTRYLLDTTVLIDFSKRREPVSSTVLRMLESGDSVGVCAINVAEFYSGARRGEDARMDRFLGALITWPITFEAAVRAGQDRFEYARAGRALSTTDVLVAAVSRAEDAILVTANVKDYPMSDLTLFPLAVQRR